MTVGRALQQLLWGIGVDAIYGVPHAGLEVIPIADPGTARLFASAHARVHGRAAAVYEGDGRLRIGRGGEPIVVGSGPELLDAFADLMAASRRDGCTLQLDLDLAPAAPTGHWPTPTAADGWVEPSDEVVAAMQAADHPVLLVGPGVVTAGAVAGLHALATAGQLGVLNTWGAKGVFDWRSPHHLATVGLQQRDFELGGLAAADLILTCGLDPDESPSERWALASTVDLEPGALDPLAGQWSRPPRHPVMPPLRNGLAAVTQAGWARSDPPLSPTQVTRSYASALGPGALVAADAGLAGFWVARTFATTELGAVHVPARTQPGFAVAVAAIARRRDPRRPVLAVVDAPLADEVHLALAAARDLNITVPVEGWDPSGEVLDAPTHADRLGSITRAENPSPVMIATDPAQLDDIIEVAGPIVAWTGQAEMVSSSNTAAAMRSSR